MVVAMSLALGQPLGLLKLLQRCGVGHTVKQQASAPLQDQRATVQQLSLVLLASTVTQDQGSATASSWDQLQINALAM